MGEAARVPFSLLVVFLSAKLVAECFERLGQPGIVGEILAGVLIGPSVLGWMSPNELLSAFSDLGVMFLLFRVGLEVKSSELLREGATALLVAVLGVIVPLALGWGIMVLWGEPHTVALFVAASMVATSVGITAQVLSTQRVLHSQPARIILAAAVIDDVLGLLVLAVVNSLAHGRLNVLELAVTTVLAIGFTVIVAKWGTRTVNKVVPHLDRALRLAESQFALAMSLLFGLSLLAVYAGVAAIVGAFLAGLALAESTGPRVRDLTNGVTELLAPFFLVGIGLRVNLAVFSDAHNIAIAAVILAAAILAKLAGCGLGAYRLGKLDALRVGIGMIPRGEVGMVVAQIGLSLGILKPNVYGVIVFMSVATTMVAPPLLRIAYRGVPQPDPPEEEIFRVG